MRACKIDEGWIQTPWGGESSMPGGEEWDAEWTGAVGMHKE